MSIEDQSETTNGAGGKARAAERDIVALGIVAAAIILFVGTGGTVMPQVVQSMIRIGTGPDNLLASALLLNIALILFSWKRYRRLNTEVVKLRSSEQQARRLAETDPLTGCLNRRSLGPPADQLIYDCRTRGKIAAVIMIDLDNFKQINDRNGHNTGDVVLQESARRIAALLPEGAVLARIGGDEFTCVIPFEPLHLDRIDQLAVAIANAVGQPVREDDMVIEATVSIGLAHSGMERKANDGLSDADTLIHMADIAMYHAKSQGRNSHAWFEASLESELRFRKELETSIRRGIARGEFVPYYEQQIDLKTGMLSGFEMLARWHSPSMGLRLPDFFIPIAEKMGVIADLSESVIAQALQDAKSWDPRLTLSVNISPIQLRDPWFAQKLLKLLVEANFPPSRLEIEITESCVHENIGMVRTLVTSLKNQGIRTSLDDFGTGYSSIAQLRNLPFDSIKIDRSIVSNLNDCGTSATIIQAITSLGEGLGLPITAEGIETEAVLEALRRLGHLKGQGYLYGRPQPADATQKQLAEMGLSVIETPQEEAATIRTAADNTTGDSAGASGQRRAGNG